MHDQSKITRRRALQMAVAQQAPENAAEVSVILVAGPRRDLLGD